MYEKVIDAAQYIRSREAAAPKIAVILGSGLGELVDAATDKHYIDYKNIPNFPKSTVVGHEGQLVFGKIAGVNVVMMQGRFHFYEGYPMADVVYPVFVLRQLGVEKLVVTNAAGGINPSFKPGDLMLIKDFINLFGTNPLIGANDERFGPRFPDMSEPYNLKLIAAAKEVANKIGVAYQEGVYVGVTGPYYETAAEIRYMGKIGADAVGMSTVPETIVANYLGMKVLGISCITNMATGLHQEKHSHEKVLETAKNASQTLCRWVAEFITVSESI
ncbi:MAG TPA: purine-nucleoside phosphorylase [Methylomusa anaerophila]|uniref:Purine nucleoside phosphorylase n=1 Tax=Methylomusa anaerophila TaxID=1930071 RepID=A0A348AFV4_9FIRM|nr:purine-nucleoside phosphorylase [Methylomusa anaerophila]BBB89952.1 purine nucleoside phosphorylase 1 [Methylomusa anaerophila]HML88321.1 purine-nucleoside phosphorylase [Methylomusa anaerophila]